MITKPMLKVSNLVIHGFETIESLAGNLKKSKNWVSEILTELEKEGFISKKREFGLRKSRIQITLANTPYALKLKDLMLEYNTIDFSTILSGVKIDLLTALCLDWKDLKTASAQAGISLSTASIYIRPLINRGILQRQKVLYKINRTAWPLLYEFLKEYRNFALLNGTVKWKYKDEILFEIDNESLKKGVYTGFYRYKDYGVKVNVVKALCYMPEKQLSKEEIFVHSLFEVNDSKTLYLALTFFLKNNLSRKKAEKIVVKYDLYTKFNNLLRILDSKEEKISVEGLPSFERSDFRRVANLYGVKNV